jgi:hypothetical protein
MDENEDQQNNLNDDNMPSEKEDVEGEESFFAFQADKNTATSNNKRKESLNLPN